MKGINDVVQSIWDWMDEVGKPLTDEEGEDELFKNEVVPEMNFVYGSYVEEPLLDELNYKKNMNYDAEKTESVEIRNMSRFQKDRLPMFSYTLNNKVNAIILDVENGLSMKTFLKGLKELAYFAYFSASSDTFEGQRYRVVIPLAEPIDAEVYDYCKGRLMKVFNDIPDSHSFESRRFFFAPSMKTGQNRCKNVIREQDGYTLDFFKTLNFTDEDMKEFLRYKEEQKQRAFEKRSVEDDERIQYYLSTDFPMMTGNGDSDSSLYKAICVCLAHDDEDTLEKVLDKARSENWPEEELERKIECAKGIKK